MNNTMFGQTEATQEFIKEQGKEMVWRQMAVDMVQDMPFEKLKRVFHFSDLDPETTEMTDTMLHDEYVRLKTSGLVKFYAQITP